MGLVLVVDDDPMSLRLLEMILMRDEHLVLTATSGSRVLELIHNYHPNLVILNDMMPTISGGEICRQIKHDPVIRDTPVILISAGLRVRDPEYIHGNGADGVLLKPCLPADVRSAVARHLSHKLGSSQ